MALNSPNCLLDYWENSFSKSERQNVQTMRNRSFLWKLDINSMFKEVSYIGSSSKRSYAYEIYSKFEQLFIWKFSQTVYSNVLRRTSKRSATVMNDTLLFMSKDHQSLTVYHICKLIKSSKLNVCRENSSLGNWWWHGQTRNKNKSRKIWKSFPKTLLQK